MGYDGKYGQVTTERKDIPADEPVIVIRAQDALSLELLNAYQALCAAQGTGPEHVLAVEKTYRRFADWQDAHPGQVKTPDTLNGEYR